MEPDSSEPSSSRYIPEQMDPRHSTGLFSRHTDSVLCCSIDGRTRLAVSGGIDDTAFVWDLNTNHVIFECNNHKESVVAAAFSVNSTYVATGDLSGYIQARNTTTGIKVFEYDVDEINWIIWHSASDFVLIAGTTKGDIWMWNVNDPSAVKTFISYGSSCTTARLLPDAMKIAAAYADGALRIFELKSKQSLSKLTDTGNSEIISIDVNPVKSILAVGCLNSSVRLLTLEALRPIGQLYCKTPSEFKFVRSSVDEAEPMDQADEEQGGGTSNQIDTPDIEIVDEYSRPTGEQSELFFSGTLQNEVEIDNDDDDSDSANDDVDHSESVESVRFSPCGEYIAAANNSGTIIIWDVSSQTIRCEKHTSIGISRAAWTNDGLYVTGCLDGKVRVYDINLAGVKTIDAHTDQVLDLALRDKIVVTASEDKTCRVIKL